MSAGRFFGAFLILATLAGCAGRQTAFPRTQFVGFDEQQRREYMAARPGEYRIQEGDKLAIDFSFLEDMDRQGIIVLPDGSVTLPGIDRVLLEGLTISEADSLITAKYAETYRNPDLSLIVDETVGRIVYVMGEVEKPGSYTIPHRGISILNAISSAGGFSDDAEKAGTVLVRMNEEGYLCQEIDLSSFYTPEGGAYIGVSLQPYDIVYVPRSRIGDFAYFSKSVLANLLNVTRILSDVRYIQTGAYRR